MTSPDVRLRTAPTADLSGTELRDLRRFLDTAFAHFDEEHWGHARGGLHVLATVGGELAGHAAVVGRQLIAGATTLRTGYVEAVATAAAFRRRGVGTAVMAEVERLIAGGSEIGALGASPAGAALYTARGWLDWAGPTAALTPDGVRNTTGERVFVLPTPSTPAGLDPGARLVCDWRRGDLW
ncbi:GNAT family N-acetyltransferase [Modestobacter roseus]|uniref:Aminoglycoside 2'-N-acetyltransferase I n=1 Tax=Modestobacter roseus TaxID=1181884 RepID=A0A562IUE1_9ACTN|nr:GNAT family N-acetyltransferase [Modestobacter roseus]TWH74627.1 aminoglycoside 2'-N-acetyltransferase I [Modestobacter roseus]